MSMIRRESFGSADDGVVLETHDALYRLLLEPDAPALSSSVESSVRASPSEDPRSYRRERSRSRSLSRAPSGRVLRRMLEDSELSNGEHEELRDGDGDVFQSLDCSYELTSMRLRAMRWAVDLGLPLKFDFMYEQNCSRSLSQAVLEVDAFYIGATVNPVSPLAWVLMDRQRRQGHERAWPRRLVLDVVAGINNGRTRTREEIDCGRQKEMA